METQTAKEWLKRLQVAALIRFGIEGGGMSCFEHETFKRIIQTHMRVKPWKIRKGCSSEPAEVWTENIWGTEGIRVHFKGTVSVSQLYAFHRYLEELVEYLHSACLHEPTLTRVSYVIGHVEVIGTDIHRCRS